MAIGDAATAAGYDVVPTSGEDGKVKHGAREINKTRDMIAVLRIEIAGNGTTPPNNDVGRDGNVYYQVI